MDGQQDADGDDCARDTTTVLVVDDDALIRRSTAALLQGRGFDVIEAKDSRDAIRTLISTPMVDVVFTDVNMPGALDGLDLARWIKDERPTITLIMTSGDPRAAYTAAQLDGVKIVLPKPYDPEEVGNIIQQYHSRQ